MGHAVRHRPPFAEQFLGTIGSSGSGGAVDYADARYYVIRAAPARQMSGAALLATAAEAVPGAAQTITATNLAELAGGTHLLSAGTLVQVFALYTRGDPATKVYVFNQTPGAQVIVKIVDAAAGAGEYDGQILGGAASASPSGGVVMPEGMSTPASGAALVLNLEEDGLAGHRLKSGAYAVGVAAGMTGGSPPRAIVFVRGALGAIAGAATLGGATNVSETSDSSSWSRDTNGTPVDVYVVSRTVYNPVGDQTLYQFFRMLSYDARGQLIAVSGETRGVVDATEACP